jgi:hypothetical protein
MPGVLVKEPGSATGRMGRKESVDLGDGELWNVIGRIQDDLFEAWNNTKVAEGPGKYEALEGWINKLGESLIFIRKAKLVTIERVGGDGRYCVKVSPPKEISLDDKPCYNAELSLNITSIDTSRFFGFLKEMEVIKLNQNNPNQ